MPVLRSCAVDFGGSAHPRGASQDGPDQQSYITSRNSSGFSASCGALNWIFLKTQGFSVLWLSLQAAEAPSSLVVAHLLHGTEKFWGHLRVRPVANWTFCTFCSTTTKKTPKQQGQNLSSSGRFWLSLLLQWFLRTLQSCLYLPGKKGGEHSQKTAAVHPSQGETESWRCPGQNSQ